MLFIDGDPPARPADLDVLRKSGLDVVTAGSAADAFARFRDARTDLVVVHFAAPSESSYEFCARLRNDPAGREVPIVAVTTGDDASLTAAFRAGATDFVSRPVHFPLLAHRVRFHLRACASARRSASELDEGSALAQTTRDLTASPNAQRRALDLAYLDSLTRLPNREYLRHYLENAIAFARRSHGRVAVLALDLDGFKRVNDTLGHAGGDELLCEVATRIASSVRECDTVSAWSSDRSPGTSGARDSVAARLGGDEFVVVLTHLHRPDDAAIVARRIGDQLAIGIQAGGTEVFVSSSIGIATFPENADDVATLLSRADAAMYQAKESGRNRFHFYTESMQQAARARMELENHLRSALARGRIISARSSFGDDEFCELSLVYQPKFEHPGGRVTGAEALLRWDSPSRGSVQPSDFIPLAEHTGLIIPLGAWVLMTACKQAKLWTDDGPRPLRVAVNVSSRQLRDRSFASVVDGALSDTGLDPSLLELEITEGVMLEDSSATHDLLTDLRRMGVRIALDDFGTGYSSLSYLTRLPIDALKIDRSFVQSIASRGAAAKITSSIVELSRSLGIEVVIEGIESAEQLAAVTTLGPIELQGFLFAKPMPPHDLEQWLWRRELPPHRVSSGEVSGGPTATTRRASFRP